MPVTVGFELENATVPSISRVRNVRADRALPVRSRPPSGGMEDVQLATTRAHAHVAVNGVANAKKLFMSRSLGRRRLHCHRSPISFFDPPRRRGGGWARARLASFSD